jgi:AraC-like DNA-binding protein
MTEPPATRETRPDLLRGLVESSLTFEYFEGSVSEVVTPYSTGWRVLPYGMVAEWRHGEAVLELEGRPKIRAADGAGLVVAAGVRHRVSIRSRTPVVCRWAHVGLTALSSLDVFAILQAPYVLPVTVGNALGDLCASLASLHAEHRGLLAGVARRRELGARLLGILVDNSPGADERLSLRGGQRRVVAALRYLDENWDGPVTRSELAAEAALSPTRFHAVFKQAVGVAPMEYLKQLRLTHAQRLLVTTDDTVARIGQRVGYADPFHFSRLFKGATGLSPAHYRKATTESLRGLRPG